RRYRRWLTKIGTVGALVAMVGFLAFCAGSVQAQEVTESEESTATEEASVPESIVAATSDVSPEVAVEPTLTAAAPGDDFDQDPWEGFNEKMFNFNRDVLDRFLLKPLATGWDFIMPDVVQRGIRNMFDNLWVVRRVVNNSLQLKFAGAGTELARFTINSTIGLAGFFDIAKDGFGIEQKDEDTGQTFGTWGMGPGPYLVLPFLPPLDVRDGIGFLFDGAMFPGSYFIPFYATVAGKCTETVNERSLNLDRFERVAETTVDLYG